MRGEPGLFSDFALCEALGYPSPRYLLPLLTWEERVTWIAYLRIRNGLEDESKLELDDGEGEPLLPPGDALASFEAMAANGFKVKVER